MSEVLFKEENLINLSQTDSSENFLFELTNFIEKENLHGKKVKINFGNVYFSQGNIENVISVLSGFNIEIEMVYAELKETKVAAIDAGLTVSGQKLEIQEEEAADETEEDSLEDILWDEDDSETEQRETLYVKQTLRSGQKLEFDGNVIIIGDCNAGSEIVASGDIIIWGILSGIAHAGSNGDNKACIRAFRINAIQLRIAELLARKPDRVELDRVDKSDLFSPEEAKVTDGEIVIYSIHQDIN